MADLLRLCAAGRQLGASTAKIGQSTNLAQPLRGAGVCGFSYQAAAARLAQNYHCRIAAINKRRCSQADCPVW